MRREAGGETHLVLVESYDGWAAVNEVMAEAGISGTPAMPKGCARLWRQRLRNFRASAPDATLAWPCFAKTTAIAGGRGIEASTLAAERHTQNRRHWRERGPSCLIGCQDVRNLLCRLPFLRTDDGVAPGEAQEMPNKSAVIRRGSDGSGRFQHWCARVQALGRSGNGQFQ